MFWFCAALSAAGVLESAICSCLVAELAGYWLHRLLPSDRLPFLSRTHMFHHVLLYGPLQPMRAEHYKDSSWMTRMPRHRPFDRRGLAIALQRYRLTMSLDALRRDSTAEGEAALQ
jgi:hypothetical protein